jgi:hypothetical protein
VDSADGDVLIRLPVARHLEAVGDDARARLQLAQQVRLQPRVVVCERNNVATVAS